MIKVRVAQLGLARGRLNMFKESTKVWSINAAEQHIRFTFFSLSVYLCIDIEEIS